MKADPAVSSSGSAERLGQVITEGRAERAEQLFIRRRSETENVSFPVANATLAPFRSPGFGPARRPQGDRSERRILTLSCCREATRVLQKDVTGRPPGSCSVLSH